MDGKKYECDAIIMCTGYLYHYPFLDPSCNVKIEDQHVSPLYLLTFLIDLPTLSIRSIPKLIVPFRIFDQQTKVFLKFLKGQIQLPSPEEMRAEMEKDFTRRLEAGFKPRHAHLLPGEWQWEFDDAITNLGNIDPLGNNTWQEKGVESVGESSVTFIGGKKYECDAIICTGYLYHYPFLDPSCNVKIGDQHISPLYLHTFLTDYPILAIWAVPKLIVPFPIYDQQAKVFLKFLKGQIQLPSPEEMRAEMEKDSTRRLEAGFKPRHAHQMPGEWQWEFDDALSRLGKIDPPVIRKPYKHINYL